MHSHSAVNFKGSMFVYGGERKGVLLNDIWRFDLSSNLWSRISTEKGLIPSPRSKHTAVLAPIARAERCILQSQENSEEDNRVVTRGVNRDETFERFTPDLTPESSPEKTFPITHPRVQDHESGLPILTQPDLHRLQEDDPNLQRTSFISISTWTLNISESPRVKLRRPKNASNGNSCSKNNGDKNTINCNNIPMTRMPVIRRSWSSYCPHSTHKNPTIPKSTSSQIANTLYRTIKRSISRQPVNNPSQVNQQSSYEEEEENSNDSSRDTNVQGRQHNQSRDFRAFTNQSSQNITNTTTDNSWQLCMYVFGGREAGSCFNKKPISAWKLYV